MIGSWDFAEVTVAVLGTLNKTVSPIFAVSLPVITILLNVSAALAGRTMRLMTMVIANSKERNFFM